MEKKITLKEFLSVLHFIHHQHRTEIHILLNFTELLASNRIKETYSYYFLLRIENKKEKKIQVKIFFSSYEEIVV